MAGRNWNRAGPNYGMGGGYMGPNSPTMGAGMGYYVNPMDRRPVYNAAPMGKPYGSGTAAGYRDDNYRRPRDDYRGGKRPRGRSPVNDKRPHGHDSYPRKDTRSGKKPLYGGRYEVKLPKMPLVMKSATVPEIRLMHHNITMPGDFSKACFAWQDAFPLYEPMKVATKTDVYILHKDVEAKFVHSDDVLDLPDADYSYSVRVMPLASPDLGELYKNTFRTADEKGDSDKVAAIKNMHFVVGGKSKSETMAIGGPWSPSLDGPNPDTNPQTLINTAIRTFKGFTGVDLSSVTEWVRFLEIRYNRGANTKAPTLTETVEEREVLEDKQEVVVFFIPGVSHLVPSEEEWEKTKQSYADTLQKVLEPEMEKSEVPTAKEDNPDVQERTDTPKIADVSMTESADLSHVEPADGEPTHYTKLDVNNMKVNELRVELSARNLDSKGVKANLICRLQNALEDEKKAEVGEEKSADLVDSEVAGKTAEDAPSKSADAPSQPKEDLSQPAKDLSEKDRRRLERLYRLGDKPAILIYPNRAARGGRFECHRVSLHSLLNYQADEQKELNFEVCLFAEQFHTMLQRDCAFTIFKAIYSAPEKDSKDVKSDQNGVDEPEPKRRRESESDDAPQADDDGSGKPRKMRRTVDLDLLFAFAFFDLGHANFIRDYDLADILQFLNLGYTKLQMKKMIAKVCTHRDHVRYRLMTDQDVAEGDENDVATLKLEPSDAEYVRDLAAGNDLLFGGEKMPAASRTIIASGSGDEALLKRMEVAEETKKSMEFKFFQIKEELERTRVRLNSCKDFEDKLKKENRELQDKLRNEQRDSRDNKGLVSTYNYLLKHSRELMGNAISEIDKQFEKEKTKREAEKAAVIAESGEKPKTEDGDGFDDADTKVDVAGVASVEVAGKTEEKEWEVVDQV